MPHIHTKLGEIDQTVTGYIVLRAAEPRVLLHRHKKLNVLLPPGGHVELTETWWQAIAHEVTEETGYQFNELQVLQPPLRIKTVPRSVLHPQPLVLNTHTFGNTTEHFHSDAVFLFTAENVPSLQPAAGESKELHWLSRQEIVALKASQIFDDTRATILEIFDTFLDAWQPLPTASFSQDLPKV